MRLQQLKQEWLRKFLEINQKMQENMRAQLHTAEK
jgi:hypothetical protein